MCHLCFDTIQSLMFTRIQENGRDRLKNSLEDSYGESTCSTLSNIRSLIFTRIQWNARDTLEVMYVGLCLKVWKGSEKANRKPD